MQRRARRSQAPVNLFAALWGCLLFVGFAGAAQYPDRPFSVIWKPVFKAETLHSVHFADTSTGWAVGENGTILATSDGGKQWQSQSSGTNDNLWGVHFVDVRTGWVVGEKGLILATDDGGRHWRSQASGTEKNLSSVCFTDSHTGWAVGQTGTILTTRDTGEHWQPQPSGTKTNLSSVYFADEHTGWVVGNDGVILLTHDAGHRWQPQPSSANDSLSGVHFADVLNGWAVGLNGIILATHDAGEHWQPQPSGTHRSLRAVHFADARNGWAVGPNGTIQARGAGGYWLPQHSGTYKDLWGVHFVDASVGWVVGEDRTILATHDGGDHWQPQTSSTAPNLLNVQFADARTGWAVGVAGTILATRDGGDHWQPQTSGTAGTLWSVVFADARTGWVVGDEGTILATQDGGTQWNPRPSGTNKSLSSVYFSDTQTGWVVGHDGIILATHDGGDHWQSQISGIEVELTDVRFADPRTGWAVGLGGAILATHDGGGRWQPQASGTEKDLLYAHFIDAHTGWAVGLAGTILSTRDAGDHWQPQTSGTEKDLTYVYFANAHTGWAVGLAGTILATRDGGDHWQLQTSPTEKNLWAVHFAPAGTGWVVGDNGALLRASPPTYAPWINDRDAKLQNDRMGRVELSFFVHRDADQPEVRARVEYRTRQRPWESLGFLLKADTDGRWHLRWNPGEFGLATNQLIEYRVHLDDGGPPLAPFHLAQAVYDPWWPTAWRDYRTQIIGASMFLGFLVCYISIFLVMLWLAPARLARLGPAARIDQKPKDNDSNEKTTANLAMIALAQRLVTRLALPWFVQRKRVRRAWTRLYSNGKAKIEQLSKPARESFLKEPDFLDAWVHQRVETVRAALDHLDLFRQRRVYVALPIRVGDAESGEMMDRPSAERLRILFARSRTVVPIVGGAGTGKSTLACALARWAIASRPEERLAPHEMLPVFIMEDTTNLVDAVARNLRRMLDGEELPDDLLHALLLKQRLLVVVDALSERATKTQHHVDTLYDEGAPLNALVITSRREPNFGAVSRINLYPERLTPECLIPFIFEYLRRRKFDALFTPRQQVALGQRVLALVEAGGHSTTVTPLLVTLLVESAINRVRGDPSLVSMPDQVPEVFLDYIRRLNPTSGNVPLVSQDDLIRAARSLALTSLGDVLVPRDFRREHGIDAVKAHGKGERAERLIDHLISIGVLERRDFAGIPLLRFGLDPVAEYLAAIERLDRLGRDHEEWADFLVQVQSTPGYPQECDGFLVALSTCYQAYRVPLGFPSLDLPWERDLPLEV